MNCSVAIRTVKTCTTTIFNLAVEQFYLPSKVVLNKMIMEGCDQENRPRAHLLSTEVLERYVCAFCHRQSAFPVLSEKTAVLLPFLFAVINDSRIIQHSNIVDHFDY